MGLARHAQPRQGLFTFAFRTRFLPGTTQIRIVPDKIAREAGEHPKTVHVEQEDLDVLTGQWLTAMRDGGDFTTIIRY